MWRFAWSNLRKVIASLSPLVLGALIAGPLVASNLVGYFALLALASLLISAFLVFILRLQDPFCFGYCVGAWLYFCTALIQLCPPLWSAAVYVLPSAWTAVGVFYRADQYWPEASLYAEVEFARGEYRGMQYFAAAHLVWSLFSGLAGAVAAACWGRCNPLYTESWAAADPNRQGFTHLDYLQFVAFCGLVWLLAPVNEVMMSAIAVLAFALMLLFGGTKSTWSLVGLYALGFGCFILLQTR